ncbi:MAG: group 1 glycosyl transferase [Parcubacteria group bacterium Athens1014_10]|nr:MAG: group 1 glycosyl transferase [Parcubacteria group bacterium Athens1014_10]TSD05530.1 MAG: group 1 glycosyl transferase [Parcubacteria group bacterium Athens0714_12]
MKIIYLADIRIPTEKAHGIQIMKMCEALRDANIPRTFSKNEYLSEKISGSGSLSASFRQKAYFFIEKMRGKRIHTNDTNKIEIELIVPKRFNFIKEDPFEYYSVKKIFKIKKIFCFDLTFFGPVLKSFAFRWSSFWFGFFSSWHAIFHQADIIYSRDFPPMFFLSFFKNNLVYEMHTFSRNPFFYKIIFTKTKKIIVITHKIKEFLIKEGVEKNKILVAPDGVDLKEFEIQATREECRKKLNLPLDKKIILYTGHLFEWKGAAVLLEAARKFEILNPKSETLFVFVGGTEKDINNFKLQIANLKLNNILMIGHRPHIEIPYWLKAADVLILPNSAKEKISQFYTSPMKMFEYMASQKPIIASELPSIKEVLNENNAILVESDNFKALARGIEKALKDNELSDKISQRAYSDVQDYTWQKRAENILNFFK